MGKSQNSHSFASVYFQVTFFLPLPSSLLRLGSLRIDDFGATTPLDFVACLLRMLVRKLAEVALKSTALVTAICRCLKKAGRAG